MNILTIREILAFFLGFTSGVFITCSIFTLAILCLSFVYFRVFLKKFHLHHPSKNQNENENSRVRSNLADVSHISNLLEGEFRGTIFSHIVKYSIKIWNSIFLTNQGTENDHHSHGNAGNMNKDVQTANQNDNDKQKDHSNGDVYDNNEGDNNKAPPENDSETKEHSSVELVKPDPTSSKKRKGYLSWDDYFMSVAFLSAQRSKDPNRQVGACIVGNDMVILGIGYNGFPRGINDDDLSWAKVSHDGDILKTKYPYVCHAEVNAILNRNHASAPGQRMYVTMYPCNECAKLIIQSGIKEVIYFTEKVKSEQVKADDFSEQCFGDDNVNSKNNSNIDVDFPRQQHSHLENGEINVDEEQMHVRNNPKNNQNNDILYKASKRLFSMAGIKVWQHKPCQPSITLTFN